MRLGLLPTVMLVLVPVLCPGKEVDPKRFVPPGHKLVRSAWGNLDGDGIKDLVLVYESPKDENPRWLKVIFDPMSKNQKALPPFKGIVMCGTCGGPMGDPFDGLTVKGNRIEISHYGGTAQRWFDTVTLLCRQRNCIVARGSFGSFDATTNQGTQTTIDFVHALVKKGPYSEDHFKASQVYYLVQAITVRGEKSAVFEKEGPYKKAYPVEITSGSKKMVLRAVAGDQLLGLRITLKGTQWTDKSYCKVYYTPEKAAHPLKYFNNSVGDGRLIQIVSKRPNGDVFDFWLECFTSKQDSKGIKTVVKPTNSMGKVMVVPTPLPASPDRIDYRSYRLEEL